MRLYLSTEALIFCKNEDQFVIYSPSAGREVCLSYSLLSLVLAFAGGREFEEILGRNQSTANLEAALNKLIEYDILVADPRLARLSTLPTPELAFYHRGHGVRIPAPANSSDSSSPPWIEASPAIPLPCHFAPFAGLSFVDLVSRRRSVRTFSPTTIPLIRVSELLDLTLRSRRRKDVRPDEDSHEWRAVASAGGLYPIRCYIVAYRIDTLAVGAYYYEPHEHRLRGPAMESSDLLAFQRWIKNMIPQQHANGEGPAFACVLTLSLTKGLQKYGCGAYTLAIKDLGALYQQLYLSCTYLGLAGCAIGGACQELCGFTGSEFHAGTFIAGEERTLSGAAHD